MSGLVLQVTTSITSALSSMLSELILAIPSIILFIIIALIGYAIAVIVARVIKRLLPALIKQAGLSPEIVSIIAGAVEAFIILIALAIAFSVLSLGPATVWVAMIAKYLPSLAGAIILLTLGLLLVDLLVDYMQKKMGATDELLATIINVLRFGLYAVIITIAANLAIFYWIPNISPYLFYDIIIASIILLFSFSIVNKAINDISKEHPEMKAVLGYARLILYAIFILVTVAIIVQPFANITQIIYAMAWGLAIAFGIIVIPLIYALAKRIVQT
ncbi:mechanosensitive ion channel family protein [Vulcanisaeta distributa]|uniref:Conserved TM helix repeat-containing protein n=1 Tax=Vulcanisaeta distributa (strain DSM 14429 / JCM 11212 / NBRC 100878 / IC-017) TaxID=572478 RepID=E1QP24_VULDI|nr:hypothetical protein [Vulcanisaeta distributa]ADN51389.1 Conserved TM helix repeat-containing protein [Vulcanisaeta distributa DSM 14429]